LQGKLAPREADARTLSYEFAGWTRRGPSVNTTIEPLAEIPPLPDGEQLDRRPDAAK
jgi:hypothetical protein